MPIISFNELLFQLKRDAFYGYAPMAEPGSANQSANATTGRKPPGTTAAKLSGTNSDQGAVEVPQTRTTNAHDLVLKIYADLSAAEQLQDAKAAFRLHPIIKYDAHRELIYLWCSFRGLTAYRDNQPLDWGWRDFIKHWDADFAVDKHELREFLRSQHMPLPTYFFPDEPDRTDDPAIVDMAVAWLKTESPDEAQMKYLRELTQKERAQRWQARINQLHKMPAYHDLTHRELCVVLANELVGEYAEPGTIERETTSPRGKNKR